MVRITVEFVEIQNRNANMSAGSNVQSGGFGIRWYPNLQYGGRCPTRCAASNRQVLSVPRKFSRVGLQNFSILFYVSMPFLFIKKNTSAIAGRCWYFFSSENRLCWDAIAWGLAMLVVVNNPKVFIVVG